MKDDAWEAPRALVVTLVRDDAKGLQVTRRSVVGQAHSRMRHVIVPAPSRDGSEAIAREWASRGEVDVWEGAPLGIYPAMNWVLDRADPADQIIFLNAGDFFLYDRALMDLARASQVARSPWATGAFLTLVPGGWIRASSPGGTDLSSTADGAHQATLAQVSSLRECGGFDESYRIVADGKLLRLLRMRHAPGVVTHPVVAYGIDGFSNRHPLLAQSELARLDHEVPGFVRDTDAVSRARQVALALVLRSRLPAAVMQPVMRRHGMNRARLLTALAESPHWPHPRTEPDSLTCCLEASP
jgi:hypothetical protein